VKVRIAQKGALPGVFCAPGPEVEMSRVPKPKVTKEGKKRGPITSDSFPYNLNLNSAGRQKNNCQAITRGNRKGGDERKGNVCRIREDPACSITPSGRFSRGGWVKAKKCLFRREKRKGREKKRKIGVLTYPETFPVLLVDNENFVFLNSRESALPAVKTNRARCLELFGTGGTLIHVKKS